jgi:hypothetical protein
LHLGNYALPAAPSASIRWPHRCGPNRLTSRRDCTKPGQMSDQFRVAVLTAASASILRAWARSIFPRLNGIRWIAFRHDAVEPLGFDNISNLLSRPCLANRSSGLCSDPSTAKRNCPRLSVCPPGCSTSRVLPVPGRSRALDSPTSGSHLLISLISPLKSGERGS